MNAAKKREENLGKIAAEEKEKHMEAEKEVEIARKLLSEEVYERQIAELKALQQTLEKKKIVDKLLSSDGRYRRFTTEEIEVATDYFSESKMIGEGAYGKVYKGDLDRTPVAIKVLCSDASEKKDEFLKEVLFQAFVVSFFISSYAILDIPPCTEKLSQYSGKTPSPSQRRSWRFE